MVCRGAAGLGGGWAGGQAGGRAGGWAGGHCPKKLRKISESFREGADAT